MGDYTPIDSYGLIGDCRTAALVGRDGSIDWLCMPQFDGPSVLGALLDRRSGGYFAVRPTGAYEASRRYLPGTNVLETTFRTPEGRLRVTDLMPVATEAEKREELWPEHQVLRVIDCDGGEVEVEVLCDPRPQYGRVVPALAQVGRLGFCYQHGAEALLLRSEVPLAEASDRPGLRGRARLRAGERRYASLVYTHGEPGVIPTFGADAERKLERTTRWWRAWAARCRYEGPYRDMVVRSALALKLMTYAPSGAVVAAPTTSLPETLGGGRNWDYRYCWLRDASITLQALLDLGYAEEAEAFVSWMLHSTRLTWPELQVLYDVHGEARIPETELGHLEGYAGSRPVRAGNAAADQLQLDVYGEVVDAACQFVRRGGGLGRETRRLLLGLGETVCRRWREPDEGIWEVRGGRRHHTFSKALCWVALDRLLELHAGGELPGAPVKRFAGAREAIRAEIEARGFSERLQSYVSVLDGDELDASLLLLSRYGYADAASPRMAATCARVEERLGVDGLLYRYRGDDGLPGREGAFGICSFWAVGCLCGQGEAAPAAARFEALCARASDLGLFAEEIDPKTGAQLGNFPQAFTHVGLIDAALRLADAPAGRAGPGARANPFPGGAP